MGFFIILLLVFMIALRLMQNPVRRGTRFKGDPAHKSDDDNDWRQAFRGGGCL